MKRRLVLGIVVIVGLLLSATAFGGAMLVGRADGATVKPWPGGMMCQVGTNPGSSVMDNGFGMMGRNLAGGSATTTPLTIDQARQAVEGYLQALNNPDLELTELMVFDNNAYARITEKSTGIGAMELLVDPVDRSVFPEYGPNMMWNLKYSPMSAAGGMMSGLGGMMGGRSGMMGGRGRMLGGREGMMGNGISSYPTITSTLSSAMTVTSQQAVTIAQQYLDQQFPGYQAATNPDAFYGYYTIDILQDGKPTGMLSVNGFNGQVFLHTWHGTFIEMWE